LPAPPKGGAGSAQRFPLPIRDLPGPTGHFLLGSYRPFKDDALGAMREWQASYGDLLRFRLGPASFCLISHPEPAEAVLIDRPHQFVKIHSAAKPRGVALILGQGLLTSSGPLWQRQRRTLQPLFVRSRLAAYSVDMLEAGRQLLQRWDACEDDGARGIDVGAAMMRVTLDAVTRTMFNASVMDKLDELSPALMTVLKFATAELRRPVRIPVWLPFPGNLAFRNAMKYLDDLVHGLIRERRDSGAGHDDLLGRLLEARDEETGLPMSDRQIRDEVLTIFAAGHETTATTLTWAWYCLAENPGCREQLERELDEVLGGREPRAEDIPRLRWVRAIVEETLRLYPPAAVITRKSVEATELGGYRVPANVPVLVNLANIHRHPDYWPEPEAFRPERFLEGESRSRHRLAYMPFGAGHRVCIGNGFALTESMLLLAMIAQRYRLDLASGQTVQPELEITLRPRNGLRMQLSRRSYLKS
jgi:cytochrome P450